MKKRRHLGELTAEEIAKLGEVANKAIVMYTEIHCPIVSLQGENYDLMKAVRVAIEEQWAKAWAIMKVNKSEGDTDKSGRRVKLSTRVRVQ